jgi:hypothetical protein
VDRTAAVTFIRGQAQRIDECGKRQHREIRSEDETDGESGFF